MKTEIEIADSNRQAVVSQLAKLLADKFALSTKIKEAHWNIAGADFYEKQKFFQFHFEQLKLSIDKVAEYVRSIVHYAYAALKSFLQLTHLTEVNREKNDSYGFIKELLTDNESIIIYYRENIHQFVNDYKDFDTSDFITGAMKDHEKVAWFLRSHLN